jgi:hypothetical protein
MPQKILYFIYLLNNTFRDSDCTAQNGRGKINLSEYKRKWPEGNLVLVWCLEYGDKKQVTSVM